MTENRSASKDTAISWLLFGIAIEMSLIAAHSWLQQEGKLISDVPCLLRTS